MTSRLTLWDEIAAVDPNQPGNRPGRNVGPARSGRPDHHPAGKPPALGAGNYPESGTAIPTLVNRLERESGVETVVVDLKWLEKTGRDGCRQSGNWSYCWPP